MIAFYQDILMITGAVAATLTLAAAALNFGTAVLTRKNTARSKKEEGPNRRPGSPH